MNAAVTSDDGCRLWTEDAGHGPALVLCHGGPGLWDYLDDVAGLLNGVGRTIRWDQRGCGRSQRLGPYTVARFVADLDEVRRHSKASQVALLGHSWGATLTLRYALAHPERVSHLIYVSGTGIDPDDTWKPEFHRSVDQQVGTDARWQELRSRSRTPAEDREYAILEWSGDFVEPATARQHAERKASPWQGINWECADSIKADIGGYLHENDVAAYCRDLRIPTLIIDGDRDQRPRWAVDSLEQALPNVRRATLTGAGHLPWVEDPHGFREAVARFLTANKDSALRSLSDEEAAVQHGVLGERPG